MPCGLPAFFMLKFGSCWVMLWVMFMRHGWRKCRKHAGSESNENRGLKGSQSLYFATFGENSVGFDSRLIHPAFMHG